LRDRWAFLPPVLDDVADRLRRLARDLPVDSDREELRQLADLLDPDPE
jgi:hypothetical protein